MICHLVILVARNGAFLLTTKCRNCYCSLDLLWHNSSFAKPLIKMTTVSRFSRWFALAQCCSIRSCRIRRRSRPRIQGSLLLNTTAAATKTSLFHISHVTQNRRSVLLFGKRKVSIRFTAAGSRSRQNLKHKSFTSSFSMRQRLYQRAYRMCITIIFP